LVLNWSDTSAGSPVHSGGSSSKAFRRVLEELKSLGGGIGLKIRVELEGQHCLILMLMPGREFVVSGSVGLSRVGVVDLLDESINFLVSNKSCGVIFEGLEVVSVFGDVLHELNS